MTTKQEALEELDKLTHAAQLTIGSHAAFDIAEKVRNLINSVPEWRTMDSAPESGDVILVYRPDSGVFSAHYVEEDAHTSNYLNPPEGECYWFSTCGDDLTNEMPTHWMPLPQPPKETQ